MAPSAKIPSDWYPLNLKQDDVDQIWDLGVTDGKAAATNPSNTADLTHYFGLKKKNDSRMGNASFDTFLQMKQNGDFEEFNLLKDKQMQVEFLQ